MSAAHRMGMIIEFLHLPSFFPFYYSRKKDRF
jgi:hypothetical protein